MNYSFYQVTVNYQKAVCQVIEKCYQTGQHTLVCTDSVERKEALDKALWSYGRRSFIPHGTPSDDKAQSFPVILSSTIDNINGAKILVLTAPELEIDNSFERVIMVFDGNDENSLQLARKRYKELKDLGNELKFYFQDKKGVWQLHAAE